MIKIEAVTKVYPNGHPALERLNLEIAAGMLGLLGPNGAGKTTLMRILATLLYPTSGSVSVFGHDLSTSQGRAATRNVLGYLPQDTGLHLNLTVEQELDYIAILKRVADAHERRQHIDRVLEQVGLAAVRREKIRTLSGGMKRRVGIALALLGHPRLIIVDEPTTGLDPAERVRFRNLLYELAGERIVILSTHIVEDVNQICADMAVLHAGHLRFHGSPDELIHQVAGRVWVTAADVPETTVISAQRTDAGLVQRVFSTTRPDPSAQAVSPTLEDAYLWSVRQAEKAEE